MTRPQPFELGTRQVSYSSVVYTFQAKHRDHEYETVLHRTFLEEQLRKLLGEE